MNSLLRQLQHCLADCSKSSQLLIHKRMCSKVLTESTIKVAVTEDSSMEFLEGCSLDESTTRKLLVDSHLSPPKRNFHSRSIMSSSKTGMSPLPASLILQKSFGFIASEMPSEMKMRSRPFTVSIEGNIGSGKSTFLQYFSATPGVATHQEPIDLWTNLGGHNLLGKLYEDPERWSFLFQSYVQLTRLNIHLQQSSSPVKLIERSLQNNRYCFLESGHDCGHLKEPEYSVLCEYYDLLESKLDIGIDLIVYLRTTPEVVHSRMMKRGRSEEADVPLKYLKVVHSYYEKWLLNHLPCAPPAPVLVIDANQELEEVRKEYDLKKPVIMGEKSI
ncbi:deoxynucleoside kinase-like isoform X2 [Homarus americanus]|uniref:deoxynucleoside kinase-like isoform X2 n=1 Tax=Homarus americanus TaxID=6706 RepID=UPI001C48158E|nr:deoxynucleoside kinase-like isoform X2 [Homarus americanus]